MTRYTVIWTKSARNELAELWVHASSRSAVTVAADLMNQELRNDAPIKGRVLSEGLRSIQASPIVALFTVSEDDRIAEVLRVRNLRYDVPTIHDREKAAMRQSTPIQPIRKARQVSS